MQKATINDVARYAGVSKKTVSRVLNNESNVSEVTKDKVEAAFKDLSYRPSQQARGLASNQSYLIALLYDNPNKSYVSDVQAGALSVCNQLGYHLVIHPFDHLHNNVLNDINRFIIQSNLDGIVLTPPFSDMKLLLDALDEHQIPIARIGATTELERSICIINNDEEVSYEITQYLISAGHTKIGFVSGRTDHNASVQRLQGYKSALTGNGIEIDERYITNGQFEFKASERCARQLMNLKSPPTAIFASNDFMAAAVLKVASQQNISVPHELSVCGFDNASISQYIWPSLSTVNQPIETMATTALQNLIKMIRKETIESTLIEFKSELLIRESTTTAPKKLHKMQAL